jgi:hypothetical protein
MLDAYIDKISLASMLGVWFLAFTKGGPAERWGICLLAANWIATFAVLGFIGRNVLELASLGLDFLMAVAFLIIAVAYSSRWLGVAMLIQGLILALHADGLFDVAPGNWRWHAICLNLANFTLLWVLAGAVGATWWKRRRARMMAAGATPPPALPTPA